MIPTKLKKIIKNILYFLKKSKLNANLKIKTKIYSSYKVIIGAGGTNYSGWMETDQISINAIKID